MNAFLGPLDAACRVPPLQQTRVASFLISAHGALASQLAMSLPGQLKAGWQTELNAQFHREAEIVSSRGVARGREAIRACEQGLQDLEDALVPGITENALWSRLQATNIATGGELRLEMADTPGNWATSGFPAKF